MQVKKGILAVLATVIMAMTSSTAFAESKIGVADPQRAILQSTIAQQAIEQINGQFSEQEAAVQEMNKEVTALLEKLKKDTELMSDQEFQELFQEVNVKRGQMAQIAQRIQQAKIEATNQLIQQLTGRYQDAVEALVLAEKYDLILPRESTHYRHELYDVTAKITEKMNALEQ